MSKVELDQAKEQLANLVEQAAGGEEIIITKDRRPLARLVAVLPEKRRQFGSARGQIILSEDFDEPLEDFEDYT
jgi:prevent-host-death family protein